MFELKLNTKQETAKERTHLFIIIKGVNTNYGKKNSEFIDEQKMSKAIEENKLTVIINHEEINLYCKFMCADENNDKKKTNLPHPLQLQFS